MCSTSQQLQEEHEHLQNILTRCKYLRWALNWIKNKSSVPNHSKESNNNNRKPISNNTSASSNIKRNYIVVPYTKGFNKSLKNVCKKHSIQVYFKRDRTINVLLVAPKSKDHITKKSGIIYRFKCDKVECDEEYIGESSKTFGEGFKEHLKGPSPIYDHFKTTSHTTTLKNFSIVGRED